MAGDGRPAAERLRQLQRLRDDGLISDDEFEAQRARILNETFSPGEEPIERGRSERGRSPSADRTPPASSARSAPAPAGPADPPHASATGEGRAADDRRSRLHPARFPNWLRIALVAGSGLWLVTIPFMFWRGPRHTWLPYVGAVTIPLFVWAFIASSLEDTTLADACRDAEAAVRQEIDGDDLDWVGDCNSDSLRGYRVAATQDGHLVKGGVDWTDAAGARKRTTFEVRVSEEQTPQVAFVSEVTVRAAPTPAPEPTTAPTATAEPEPDAPGIGDLITVGSLDLTILNVERYDAGLYIDANVRLHIEAVNARGDEDSEYNLNAYFFKLVDSSGIAYEPYPLLCASACPDQIW